jgi:hypothetical protein
MDARLFDEVVNSFLVDSSISAVVRLIETKPEEAKGIMARATPNNTSFAFRVIFFI